MDRIGPYEIVGLLGAGGMGEVYRARDSRLNRDVAIKILPASVAADPERTARFQREAQVLAALNHPNIAAIYGVEESALVMELVEGETLAERIAAGSMPVDEAVMIARQIADALDAAHQKNIIHRDLKPANVKVTPQDAVKVLDFGLAKAFETRTESGSQVNSPTITMGSTHAGMILGTAGYMSPEQARGKIVDKRADIWSFGAVLYEMLTGQRAFEGETMSDTLAAVLRGDVDWKKLPANTPVGVRKLLERCLERDVNKRLRDIGDAWNDMDRTEQRAVVAAAPQKARFPWIPWSIAAAALVLASGVGAWGWLHEAPAVPRTVTRSAMTVANAGTDPALSRDGRRLAYVQMNPKPQLMIRMMNELNGSPIPGADPGYRPAFSPDGQWIAYSSLPPTGNLWRLKRIPVTGGTPITICDLPGPSEPTWGADDQIVFGSSKGLMKVSAGGGAPQAITLLKEGELGHNAPDILPGGQGVLFTIRMKSAPTRVAVLDLKKGTYRAFAFAGQSPRYTPTGHIVFARGAALFAVPFDPQRLEVTGPEAPVIDGVFNGRYTFADSSLLVFEMTGQGDAPSTLEWTGRKGDVEALPEPAHFWGSFEVSPDGKTVATAILDRAGAPGAGHYDLWVYEVERKTLARLTFEGSNNAPVWSPDGKWIAYDSVRDGRHAIYRIKADRSGQPELVLAADGQAYPKAWTPDGKNLLYTRTFEGKSQIWVLPVAGTPRLFSKTPFSEENPQVSADGKWVVYSSDETGKQEIYVVPFSGVGGKFQISTKGGREPKWSRNGKELFYKDADTNQLMAVDIQGGALFRAGQPAALFQLSGGAWFSVTPDPRKFLVERVPDADNQSTFITVNNWFDDLEQRAPVRR